MFEASIIIPTYNEAKNLPILVKEIFESIDLNLIDLELIIVDDNSPDGTGQIARKLSEKFNIKVIHRPRKLGLGSAVITGFKESKRNILGVMDGDLSHDPNILNQLIKSLTQFDITIGSRFKKESNVEGWTRPRKILSQFGIILASLLVGKYDILSGYFFIKRSVIENIQLKTTGYKILFEILVKGNYKKVKEYGYIFRKRMNSSSKLNLFEYYLFIKQLIAYTLYKMTKSKNKYGKNTINL